MRIGHGYDVHRLKISRPCILCGVAIPSDVGPDGHSDADVAVHALMDALLGAAALGDIGKHFPDSDERYKGADGMALLRQVIQMIREKVIWLEMPISPSWHKSQNWRHSYRK